MSKNQRLALIASTLVVAVVAFLIFRPTGSDEPAKKSQPTAKTSQGGKTQTEEANPGPTVDKLAVRNGQPVGGKKTFKFTKDENARIDVTSDKAGEVHLHGYDIEKEVNPGKTTKFQFKADIEGVFDLEDHASDAKLANVEVGPK
jgi:hypothetical protein